MKIRIEAKVGDKGTSYSAGLTVTKESIRSAARNAKNALKSILELKAEKPEDTEETKK